MASIALLTATGVSAAQIKPALVITGAPHARSFAISDLAKLPRATATRIDHGKRISCEGVAVIDLLTSVGLPSGEAIRGSALSTIIVASARDGYRVAFTLAEFDRALGNSGAIVADECGGAPLEGASGPLRIVVPEDKRGARSIRQLEVLAVTEPAAR